MAGDSVSNTEHEPSPKSSRKIFLPFPHLKHYRGRKKKVLLSLLLCFQQEAALFRAQRSTGDADPEPDSHCNGNQMGAADLNGN